MFWYIIFPWDWDLSKVLLSLDRFEDYFSMNFGIVSDVENRSMWEVGSFTKTSNIHIWLGCILIQMDPVLDARPKSNRIITKGLERENTDIVWLHIMIGKRCNLSTSWLTMCKLSENVDLSWYTLMFVWVCQLFSCFGSPIAYSV